MWRDDEGDGLPSPPSRDLRGFIGCMRVQSLSERRRITDLFTQREESSEQRGGGKADRGRKVDRRRQRLYERSRSPMWVLRFSNSWGGREAGEVVAHSAASTEKPTRPHSAQSERCRHRRHRFTAEKKGSVFTVRLWELESVRSTEPTSGVGWKEDRF